MFDPQNTIISGRRGRGMVHGRTELASRPVVPAKALTATGHASAKPKGGKQREVIRKR